VPLYSLNPVNAKLVNHPREWIYSNFLEWVGERNGSLVDREFIRQYFPTDVDYGAFVQDGVGQALEEELYEIFFD
jgi:putative transposase